MNDINKENINIKLIDNTIHVLYEDYEFEINKEDIFNPLISLPKNDLNNKKSPLSLRLNLKKYLLRNYDTISIPQDMKLIEVNEIKSHFNDLIECEQEEKEQELRKQFISPFYLLFTLIMLLFLIIEVPKMIPAIRDGGFPLSVFLIIIPIIILLILSYLLNKKTYEKANNNKLYKTQVKIFDLKKEQSDDSVYYYIRVYKDNYIINKWFPTKDKNITQATLYYLDSEKPEAYIEKEVD